MVRHGRDKIKESFEDRPSLSFVGFLCVAYFYLHFAEDSLFVKRILPPFPAVVYIVVAVGILISQITTWFKLGHFEGDWYKSPRTYLFFICEMAILVFSIGFLLWPIYWMAIEFHWIPKPPPTPTRP